MPSPTTNAAPGASSAPGPSRRAAGTGADGDARPNIGGVTVREHDIEPVQGLRSIALLFRGMALLMLGLMVARVGFAITTIEPVSPGAIAAEAIRLVIFAGLLWGAGDLAVLGVKSHYDLRATRILMARVEYTLRQLTEAGGTLATPPARRPEPRDENGTPRP